MWFQVLTVTDSALTVNYGLNKVRFPAPVAVGSKVRLTATVADVEQIKGGYQLTASAVIEREHGDKPVCAAAFGAGRRRMTAYECSVHGSRRTSSISVLMGGVILS